MEALEMEKIANELDGVKGTETVHYVARTKGLTIVAPLAHTSLV